MGGLAPLSCVILDQITAKTFSVCRCCNSSTFFVVITPLSVGDDQESVFYIHSGPFWWFKIIMTAPVGLLKASNIPHTGNATTNAVESLIRNELKILQSVYTGSNSCSLLNRI